VILTIQPGVARIFLTDQLLADQGVLSRILVAAPASLSSTRFYKEPSPESDQKLTIYNQLIHDLLATPMPLKADTKNELSPRIIALSQQAKQKWISYANFVESELLPSKKYEPIKGLANKLAEHAARIATILAVVQDSFVSEVDGVNMENGIALANYYAAEAVKMCEEGSVDKQILLAERLLKLKIWPVSSGESNDSKKQGRQFTLSKIKNLIHRMMLNKNLPKNMRCCH
jgi:hypothetical protein